MSRYPTTLNVAIFALHLHLIQHGEEKKIYDKIK